MKASPSWQDANYNATSLVTDGGGFAWSGNTPTTQTFTTGDRYVYDPYGRREVLNATWTADTLLGSDGTTADDATALDNMSDHAFFHGHQGGRHDLQANLAHFRFRDLNVLLGRWTRQDPLGYVDGASMYLPELANPLIHVDPLGTASQTTVKAGGLEWIPPRPGQDPNHVDRTPSDPSKLGPGVQPGMELGPHSHDSTGKHEYFPRTGIRLDTTTGKYEVAGNSFDKECQKNLAKKPADARVKWGITGGIFAIIAIGASDVQASRISAHVIKLDQ